MRTISAAVFNTSATTRAQGTEQGTKRALVRLKGFIVKMWCVVVKENVGGGKELRFRGNDVRDKWPPVANSVLLPAQLKKEL